METILRDLGKNLVTEDYFDGKVDEWIAGIVNKTVNKLWILILDPNSEEFDDAWPGLLHDVASNETDACNGTAVLHEIILNHSHEIHKKKISKFLKTRILNETGEFQNQTFSVHHSKKCFEMFKVFSENSQGHESAWILKFSADGINLVQYGRRRDCKKGS